MGEWRDIETAPKDGTIVQLFDEHHGVVVGWYRDDPMFPWVFIDSTEEVVTGCCDNEDEDRIEPNAFSAGRPPAYWKPLSERPEPTDA